MRKRTTCALLIIGAALLIALPAITVGQIGFKGKGGGMFGGSKSNDPGAFFDNYLSKKRPYFLISETNVLREALTQYAQEKGITNGQITRQQYIDFVESRSKAAQAAGTQPGAPGGATPGGENSFGKKPSRGDLPPGVSKTEAMSDPNLLNQLAEAEFKYKDKNGDGKLNQDEMQNSLRSNLARWDKNNDALIDLAEYREYFIARFQGEDGTSSASKAIASIIIEENELDLKPTVLRAGKLPKNMPGWFKELDTDNDGQVGLYESRTGKKNLDEFRNWDLNEDGFITPEECLRQQDAIAKSGGAPSGTSLASRGGDSGANPERPAFKGFGGGGGGGGFPNFGKGGDFGKTKGKDKRAP